MISFCRSVNVRSIIRISPARTCGYSRLARSSPRIEVQPRPLVDLVERGRVAHLARVGDGDEVLELPVVLDRERDALLVGERPHDLGGDRAAEVGVQLGEAFLVRRLP
jgi:hypothetical protein